MYVQTFEKQNKKRDNKRKIYDCTCPLPEDDNAGRSDKKRLSADPPPPTPPHLPPLDRIGWLNLFNTEFSPTKVMAGTEIPGGVGNGRLDLPLHCHHQN